MLKQYFFKFICQNYLLLGDSEMAGLRVELQPVYPPGGGRIPLSSALPKERPANSQLVSRHKQESCEYQFFKSWYDSTGGLNPGLPSSGGNDYQSPESFYVGDTVLSNYDKCIVRRVIW